MSATRPVSRYHGGKWRLAPWIAAHFPPHDVYVEPFGGLASVLLRKARSRVEVYNDADGALVALFHVLRDPPAAEALRRALVLTPYSRAEYEAAMGVTGDAIEDARRLLVRLYMGFGTRGSAPTRNGFRLAVFTSHASPATAWHNWPAHVAGIVERLRGVILEHGDARELIPRLDSPATLFYIDPPYLPETRTAMRDRGRGLYEHELTTAEHVALLELLRGLVGYVVLSGYPAPLYHQALGDWTYRERRARVNGGKLRTEGLWLNSPAAAALLAVTAQRSLSL